MLRKINPEIALGFFVASLFWLCVVGWQGSYVPTEKQKDECYETAKKTGFKTDECKTFWERTTSDPVALFNLILAFSTVGLWVATISLYRAGNKQLELGRQEFIATHRPRVIVRFIQGPFPGLPDGDGRQFIWVTFANIGETPATIETFGCGLNWRDEKGSWDPPGMLASPKDIPHLVLATGEGCFFVVKAANPYGDGDIFRSTTDQSELCAVGRVQYRDENGVIRETAFFRIYDDESEAFIPSKNPEDEYQD
jgi:hypothetical protein